MAPSSSINELRQFIKLTADLGVRDGGRLVLRELGIRTYQTTSYPGLARMFAVQFDPVWRWISRGERELGLLRFAKDRIERGDLVLDVGAHLGESALLFSELVGASGRVVAFEPDPIACASLRRNLELNGIANVIVEEESAGDKTDKVLLTTDRFGSGLASIVQERAGETPGRAVVVESTTLDDYCEKSHLSPDWIKIDAEGAEPLVIKGMERLIETAHPGAIVEFHSDTLADEERRHAWLEITRRAKLVSVLETPSTDRAYLEELPKDFVPDRQYLMVYIQY